MTRRLFVIMVHYGPASPTQEAVTSLLSGDTTPEKIVVVDHAAEPLVLAVDPTVVVVRPSDNGGYGSGINIGLGVLYGSGLNDSDIVVAMNNNAVVYPDALSELAAWWKQNPEPAVVGATVEEGQRVVHGGGQLNQLTGRTELATDAATTALDYIHGAFLAAPWRVFTTLKGMPDQYFLYWEDVLFSHRARQAGWPLRQAERVRVRHETRVDGTQNDNQLYYLVRNGALFMSRETAWPLRQWWKLYNRLRQVYHQQRGTTSPIVREALADAVAGVQGRRESSPT